jgi:hypothetical protein
MKQSTLRHCLILFTGSLLLALAPAAFAQPTPGGSSGGAGVRLLNLSSYSSDFADMFGSIKGKYVDNVSDDDFYRVAALGKDTEDVDTPLEISLLSYYSKPVINIRPIEAQKELPANSKDSA